MRHFVLFFLCSYLTGAFCFQNSQGFIKNRAATKFFQLNIAKNKGTSTLAPKVKPIGNIDLLNKDEPEEMSSTDKLLYGILASIQILPPLAIVDLPESIDVIRRPISYLYFIVSATILVVLGAKRQDISTGPQQEPISPKSALLAPFVSSAVIFTIYCLLKYTDVEIYFDKGYQFLGTLLGVLSFDFVTTRAGQSIFPQWVPNNKIFAGEPESEENREPEVMNSDEGLIAGLVVGGSYLLLSYFGGGITNPESLFALSFFNNLLASGIALQTIGTVKVESFAVACALLSGLFFYDIYWVFFSEVMMTVATKVDAPIKFLFPASIESMPGRPYPFSVLGLGDIVVPGIMAALARKIDVEGLPSIEPFVVPSVSDMIEDKNQGRAATVWPNFFNTRDFLIARFAKKEDAIQPEPVIPIRELRRQQGKVSYLSYITVGYTLGLGGAFTANEISRSGQPALLYLVPLSILAMLAAAYKNDEVKELWGEGISFADKTPKIEQLE